jgi:hypothetical protein
VTRAIVYPYANFKLSFINKVSSKNRGLYTKLPLMEYWSNGVLEYWKPIITEKFDLASTPLLH